MTTMNLVQLAIADLTTASALLRKPRSGVTGLDIRYLTGGSKALALGPQAFDVYVGAISAGLDNMNSLTSHNYIITAT